MINDPECEGCHRETPDDELFRCRVCGHRCCDDCTNHPGDDAGPCVDCEAVARKKLDAGDTHPKWTPERIAALRSTIEAARAFVRCADEFVPREGEHFYPDALDEYFVALGDAIEAEGRAWDAEPATATDVSRVPCPGGEATAMLYGTLAPCDGFVAPAGNPGARVVESGR